MLFKSNILNGLFLASVLAIAWSPKARADGMNSQLVYQTSGTVTPIFPSPGGSTESQLNVNFQGLIDGTTDFSGAFAPREILGRPPPSGAELGYVNSTFRLLLQVEDPRTGSEQDVSIQGHLLMDLNFGDRSTYSTSPVIAESWIDKISLVGQSGISSLFPMDEFHIVSDETNEFTLNSQGASLGQSAQVSAVPEPSTGMILVLILGGIHVRHSRKREKSVGVFRGAGRL